MTRQSWKDALEGVGIVAVVASLIFVGIETRNSTRQAEQNTKALEIAAYQALMSNIDEMNALGLQSPSAASAMAEVWEGDEAVDTDEFLRNRLLYILFRHGDLAFFMYERGAIDEDRLRSALGPVPIRTPVGRMFWEQRKDTFTENYRTYLDRQLAVSETEDTAK